MMSAVVPCLKCRLRYVLQFIVLCFVIWRGKNVGYFKSTISINNADNIRMGHQILITTIKNY